MANIIKLKRGTSTPSTSDISNGEVAIDTSAKKFYINDSGTIKQIGGTTTSPTFTGDVSTEDKIVHTGDTDTAIRFPAVDTFAIETGGSERARIDSSGRCIIGGGTHSGDSNLVVKGDSNLDSNNHAVLGLFGDTVVSAANTELAQLKFGAGNTNTGHARIRVKSDAAWGSGDYPTAMLFETTPDGSSTMTTALELDSSQSAIFAGDVQFSGAANNVVWDKSDNALEFANNAKAVFGASSSLSIWSTGSEGMIQAPSGGGIHIGDADKENIIDVEPTRVVINKSLWLEDGDLSIRGSGYQKILWDLSDNALEFEDNIKAIFGAGTDLTVYSDGTNGFVSAGAELRLGTTSSNTSLVIDNSNVTCNQTATFTGNILMSGTGVIDIPAGTTAQRPGSADTGMFRYNTTLDQFEGYSSTGWGAIGGGETKILETPQTISQNLTLTSSKNALSVGSEVAVANTYNVTVPSGSSWSISQ